MFDCLFSYSLIIIIIIIQILFNERHHSTFDSKPKNVFAEATRRLIIGYLIIIVLCMVCVCQTIFI